MPMLVEFENFPDEKEVVGSLLIAYGELEFALMECVDVALVSDIDKTARIFFRIKGEAARMDVADAILRPAFTKIGLAGKWSNAFGALKHCKTIRNQYAHCHWQTFNKRLYFINFDQDAQLPAEGQLQVKYLNVDFHLLFNQQLFFKYTADLTYYLLFEYQKKTGQIPSHDLSEPKSLAQPNLYNPDMSGPSLSASPKGGKK
jgi:hypothetical protein